MNKDKVISIDALHRLILQPLKKLIDKKAETWEDLGNKPNVLVYDAQDLTVEQREQVKQNIGAYELQVQSDWAETDETSPAYIKNKAEWVGTVKTVNGTQPDDDGNVEVSFLPAAAPYQQLVTDGSGNWVAEDRLAYKERPLLGVTTLTVDDFTESNGKYTLNEYDTPAKLANVNTYVGTVVVLYSHADPFVADIVHEGHFMSMMYYGSWIGNGYLMDSTLEDTGEPYCIYSGTYSMDGSKIRGVVIDGTPPVTITCYGHEVFKPLDADLLPTGTVIEGKNMGAAYQQFVTDGDGVVQMADRLAYENIEHVVIIENATYKNLDGGIAISAAVDTSNPINVIFDGVSYPDVAFDGQQYGNRYLYELMLGATEEMLKDSGIVDTGVPFTLEAPRVSSEFHMRVFCYDYADHVVSVYQEHKTVKPLDPKFLPTTIPNIQSATVGQTVVVKAVDEDGRPTEWETKDMGGGSDEVYTITTTVEAGGEHSINISYADLEELLYAGNFPKIVVEKRWDDDNPRRQRYLVDSIAHTNGNIIMNYNHNDGKDHFFCLLSDNSMMDETQSS